jgi:hypothetical protein
VRANHRERRSLGAGLIALVGGGFAGLVLVGCDSATNPAARVDAATFPDVALPAADTAVDGPAAPKHDLAPADANQTDWRPDTPLEPTVFSRPLPNTSDKIYVFADQLGNKLTAAQAKFAATHFVGSQKLTKNVSDQIRAYNQNFIVLQYRLAFGLAFVNNITGLNDWQLDTLEPGSGNDPRTTKESYYMHVGGMAKEHRVVHKDSYYLADPRDQGWRDHHIGEILRRMPLNDFDGVFLDTAHLRIDGFAPYTWYESFCGASITVLDDCWNPPSTAYFNQVVNVLHGNSTAYYAIGNFGSLITSWDDNASLATLDGGMLELFMTSGDEPLNEGDWHIIADRIVKLIGNDKILIAQPDGYSISNGEIRRWIAANFLLFKGSKSFLNLLPEGIYMVGPPAWFPEYELDLGPPKNKAASAVTSLCTSGPSAKSCSGVYLREYKFGFAVLNPAPTPRALTLPALPAGLFYRQAKFVGGGEVDGNGAPASYSLDWLPSQGGLDLPITMAPSTGKIILRVDQNGTPQLAP